MDPIGVVIAAAAGLGATGVTAAVAKLFSLGTGQARIETKIDDHIHDERGKFDGFTRRFDNIDTELGKKLPNGEMKAIIGRLALIERHVVRVSRVVHSGKKAAAAARRKR